MLYRKGIEKRKLYSLEWGQCSFLEIQKRHFGAHDYVWEMMYTSAEAEGVSRKPGRVPRSQQHFRCPWGCTLSAAFAEDRKTNIRPASPAARIWIRNCPNDQLNYLPAQVIRGSSYFSLHFCGADSFPQDGKHCLLLTAAPLSTGARAAGPCVLTEDRLTSLGFARPVWCACSLPFVLPAWSVVNRSEYWL